MTALKEYDRLEAPGLWRPDPSAQRVDVVVSIGDATLTLTDHAERALTHWSLAALHRKNPSTRPALYAPSEAADEAEELELSDDDMIAAIERIRKAIARRRPRSGRVRLVLTGGIAAALVAFAIVWVPDSLTRQTVTLLPEPTRAEVGERLLTRIRRVAGAPCTSASGQIALDQLTRRVLGTNDIRVLVVPDGVETARVVPGRIILLNRDLIEDEDEPDVAAGFLLAEFQRAQETDPMRALLDHAGFVTTAKLLTTGEVADAVLDDYARHLLTAETPPLDTETLLAAFETAGLRSTPYAYAVDPSGETTLPLIEADPVPVSAAEPLLPDAAWVSLQSICET
ncbi:MAG: hypothetical protein VX874_11925 [Pseudomonadota bacterium]|nr:hypothetical protein [Pseudomonadota bacterium]